MLNIRNRIRTDLNTSKWIRSRIRSENIRTVFTRASGFPHVGAGRAMDVGVGAGQDARCTAWGLHPDATSYPDAQALRLPLNIRYTR